ncbi:TPA: polysaccharide pyruvyl transferase family protein [Citrobacter amalonaticus]|uniref:Polysaccharide pyruvyl transferase family protein n=1 Tax=Citrobacter amalonaticus TaxID=35703 RepID=A0A9C7QL24_CITAM|nr:polysaccharide pyruvyl transferase family protein [Citrobacter amalonaticus]
MNNNWLSLMQSLKNKHSHLATLIGSRKVAFIDIPMYFNVGDILIYFGTENFFKEYNINVIYRAGQNINNRKIKDVDVIVLQGGGNFGDLYPHHQKLREYILKTFMDKTIICLPQTLHFSGAEQQAKSAKIFKAHSDFHLFVRDDASLDIGKEFTEKVSLMPDMAHSLHPLIDIQETDLNSSISRILNMKRVDDEKNNKAIERDINKIGFDWNNIISPSMYIIGRSVIKLNKLGFKKSITYWNKISEDMFFKSVNYFMAHDTVYSDRLHGIILATLLGKKIKLYDNSYGKNTGYLKCWLRSYPGLLNDIS